MQWGSCFALFPFFVCFERGCGRRDSTATQASVCVSVQRCAFAHTARLMVALTDTRSQPSFACYFWFHISAALRVPLRFVVERGKRVLLSSCPCCCPIFLKSGGLDFCHRPFSPNLWLQNSFASPRRAPKSPVQHLLASTLNGVPVAALNCCTAALHVVLARNQSSAKMDFCSRSAHVLLLFQENGGL